MREELGKHYHLICVNYDGFDGSDLIFPDMITVTEKIEKYILENCAHMQMDPALSGELDMNELQKISIGAVMTIMKE